MGEQRAPAGDRRPGLSWRRYERRDIGATRFCGGAPALVLAACLTMCANASPVVARSPTGEASRKVGHGAIELADLHEVRADFLHKKLTIPPSSATVSLLFSRARGRGLKIHGTTDRVRDRRARRQSLVAAVRGELGIGLLSRALQLSRQHRLLTAAVGVILEIGLMALFSPAVLGFPKGTPGALGVAVAVVTAMAAGAGIGVGVACLGWIALFVVQTAPSTVIALPIWVLTAYVVGMLSDALLDTERSLGQQELDRIASHEVRTPLATIAGLARVLRESELPEREARTIETIEHEASRMLEIFDRRRGNGNLRE